MKKRKISFIILSVIFALAVIPFILGPDSALYADSEKDLILVLDTSYSMSGHPGGHPGKNILPQVKKSLPKFIDQLESGDSVTLITFDTTVKYFPTLYIDDEKNKESLITYLENIEAKGAWTYTKLMVETVLKKAQEMDSKDEDRQQVIVVLTDALDDPPPGKTGDRLNIRDVGKTYKDKDWFIFFINFGDAANNKKLVKLQNQINKKITAYTGIINAQESPGKVIEEDLKKNIDEMTAVKDEREWTFPYLPLLIALIIIAIILFIIFYIKGFSLLKVKGNLEFWDHTVLNPYIDTFNMTKYNLKEITIGAKKTNLVIRDLEIKDPIRITAVRDKKNVKNVVNAGKNSTIEYINCEPGGSLNNGDMFKVANYTFKYIAAQI